MTIRVTHHMLLLKDKNIFIVEDNSVNRVVFQMALVRHGAILYFEREGANTIRLLHSATKPDLIILDLMLAHGETGFNIFDQIRQVPLYAQIPIVAVSAMDPSVAIPMTQDKGFQGFIAKPVNVSLFGKQLADVIAGANIWYAGDRILY